MASKHKNKQGCGCNVSAETCIIEKMTDREGVMWHRIPYALIRDGRKEVGPCHDCGVAIGGFHHTGCDWEICPKCGGQRFICNCFE